MPPTTQINPAALAAIRERSGLSITQLAALVREQGVKCERSHLSNIEAGRRGAPPALRQALAEALKVPLTAIITTLPQAPRDSAA